MSNSGVSLARTAAREIGHVAVGGLADFLGGGVIGFSHARWKDHWLGEYLPEMAAGVGTVAEVILRAFGGETGAWIGDVVGGGVAGPGRALSGAKLGIKLAEHLEEKKAKELAAGGGQKQLPAAQGQGAGVHGLHSVGAVPAAGSSLTISEEERRRWAATR